jgi:microcystin-dependent protein
MIDPFVGQIIVMASNFAPQGFAFCHGQLLPISQNTALFQLLGTTYGGDGKSTFALPNLNGRVPVGFGQGPGLSDFTLGQETGAETITLLTTEMPSHVHAVSVTGLTATPSCRNAAANQASPANNVPAIESSGVTATYSDQIPDATMRSTHPPTLSGATASTGGGQSHNNMQPYLVLNYFIALQGVFPQHQ